MIKADNFWRDDLDDRPVTVSIRCTVFNQAPYIRQCLDSFIAQQTNFRIEAIVHDDCSTDGTVDIIKEYAEKYPSIIKPIFEEENQYSKRNGSLSRVVNAHLRGKYIAYCEGDDYWTDPLKLQKQVDFLEAHPDYGMVYTKTRYYFQDKHRFRKAPFGGPYVDFNDILLKPHCIPTATVLLKNELYHEYYNEHKTKNKWAMGDYPLALFCALKSKIYFLDEITAVYRILKVSACHFKTLEQDIKFTDSVYEVKKYFINLAGLNESDFNLIDSYNYDIWKRSFIHNRFDVAKQYSSKVKSDSKKIKAIKALSKTKLGFNLICFIRKVKLSII